MLIRLLSTTAVVLALAAPVAAQSVEEQSWENPDPRAVQIAQIEEGAESQFEDQPKATSDDAEATDAEEGTAAESSEPMEAEPEYSEDTAPESTEPDSEAAAEVPAGTTIIAEQTPDQWRADTLFGMSVTNLAGENIGNVDDLLIAQDGVIEGVVVSIGGFLGIGEKHVALGWDEFEVDEAQDVVLVDLTRDQMEAAPDFRTKEQVAEQAELDRLQQAEQPLDQPLGQQAVPPATEEPATEGN
jgi:hypothetical protein